MQQKLSHRKGETLFEVILATALLVIFVAVLTTIMINMYKTYSIETTRSGLQLSSKSATGRIVKVAQQGLSIVSSQGSYTTTASSVIIQLASIDGTKTIIPATYDYIIYRLNPSNTSELQQITVAGVGSARVSGTRSILSNVSSLALAYYDASGTSVGATYANTKRFKLTIVTSETATRETVTNKYAEFITLRNK